MGVFGPGFLLDPSTMLPVAGRVVAVTDPDTGEPVTTTEADGTTPRTVVTNLRGHYPQFHVAGTWAVLLSAGGVEEVVAAIDRDPGGGGGGGAVDSVNGQVGAVVLDAGDVGAAPTVHTHAIADVTDAGGAASLDVGTTAGTVAAGDHTHTPAAIGAATAAQGSLADTAVQPGDDAGTLGSGAATSGQVLTADGAGATSWADSGASGTVTSVNEVEPDESGNVTLDVIAGALDPADPSGLTLLLTISSRPSVTLSVTTDGWDATATFTGTSPEGLALTYSIDWGDGTPPAAATSPAVHTYPSVQADYTVTVTVTDAEGGTATDTALASVAPPGVSAYGAAVLADAPVVFYPMTDESPAFPLMDYTGTASMTVTSGTVTSEAVDIGGGPRSFKFTGGRVSIGQPPALDSMTAWSFEIIARQTIENRQGGFFERMYVDGAFNKGVQLLWAKMVNRYLPNGPQADVDCTATYPTTMSDPTHFVGTFDGTTMRLYANGTEIAQTAAAGGVSPAAGTADWTIGAEQSVAQHAYLSGAAIYDYALTPERVAAHAAAAGL